MNLEERVTKMERELEAVRELLPKIAMGGSQASGVVPTSVELEHKVTHFELQVSEEHVKADTTTINGRILYAILKDPSFWEKRRNPPEVTTKLSTYGWEHKSKTETTAALLELCQKGIFTRLYSTGNYWWYTLQPDAKARIHE